HLQRHPVAQPPAERPGDRAVQDPQSSISALPAGPGVRPQPLDDGFGYPFLVLLHSRRTGSAAPGRAALLGLGSNLDASALDPRTERLALGVEGGDADGMGDHFGLYVQELLAGADLAQRQPGRDGDPRPGSTLSLCMAGARHSGADRGSGFG